MKGARNYGKPDPSWTDDELAAAARTDQRAFGLLYRRYLDRVYRYTFSKTSNQTVAEELTSTIFLDALEALPRYQPQGSFAAWLFTIARRRCADYHRSSPPLPLITEALPNFDNQPEAENDRRDTFLHLERVLRRLSQEELHMLQLRYAAELSHAEIGRVLGKSEAAVKMAHSRLIHRMRGLWEIEHEQ